MQKKHIVWIVVAVVAYVLWRKFGGAIKTAITNATK